MDNFGYILSFGLAVGSVLFLVAMVAITLLTRNSSDSLPRLRALIRNEGGTIFFMMSAVAVITSLLFSEVIGWEPCLLCWYQRIFYYPLPLLAGLALYRKSFSEVIPYLSILSWGGMLIALWHSLLQQVPGLREALSGFSSCSVSGPSCFDRYVEIFGFFTIPLMSLVTFVALLLLLRLLRRELQH